MQTIQEYRTIPNLSTHFEIFAYVYYICKVPINIIKVLTTTNKLPNYIFSEFKKMFIGLIFHEDNDFYGRKYKNRDIL